VGATGAEPSCATSPRDVGARRLPAGGTYLVTRDRRPLLEVDDLTVEVLRVARDVLVLARLRDLRVHQARPGRLHAAAREPMLCERAAVGECLGAAEALGRASRLSRSRDISGMSIWYDARSISDTLIL